MNIEHKKTALDDDSILYQKRGENVSKDEINALSKEQKIQYFKDYYLAKILVIAAIVAGVLFMSYTVLFDRSEYVFSVAVLGSAYISEPPALEARLSEELELDAKKQSVSVANYDLNDSTQTMAFVARLTNHDLDVVLCDPESFTTQAQFDHFYSLENILTPELMEKFKDRLVYGAVANTDDLGNVIGYQEEKPYGIDVTDSPFYKEFGGYSDKAIIGISVSTERSDMVLQFLNTSIVS